MQLYASHVTQLEMTKTSKVPSVVGRFRIAHYAARENESLLQQTEVLFPKEL